MEIDESSLLDGVIDYQIENDIMHSLPSTCTHSIVQLVLFNDLLQMSRGPIYKESYDVSYDSRKIVRNLS